MSDFECPQCHDEVSAGDIPDHFIDMRNNRFEYECDCGCTFEVDVEWDPVCYVREDSIRFAQPNEAADV